MALINIFISYKNIYMITKFFIGKEVMRMKKGPKKVICFLTDNQTFEELHQHSDKTDISVSQLLRSLVRKLLASENQTITQDN